MSATALGGIDRSPRDLTVEHARLGQAAHLDEPVDRDPLAIQGERPVLRQVERDGVEIDVRRQTAVEPQLLDAIALASVHPGHTPAEVRRETGFDYDERQPAVTAAPCASDLALIRGPVGAAIAETYPAFAARVLGIGAAA